MTAARLEDLVPDALFESEELFKHLKELLENAGIPGVSSFLASNFVGFPILANSFMQSCFTSIQSLDSAFSQEPRIEENLKKSSYDAFNENISKDLCASLFVRPFDCGKADQTLQRPLVFLAKNFFSLDFY